MAWIPTRRRRDGAAALSLSRGAALLPVRSSFSAPPTGFSFSCWYCNYKTTIFNGKVYLLGQKYMRFLHVWFTIGIGFALLTMVGVILILLFETSSLIAPRIQNISFMQKSSELLHVPKSLVYSMNRPLSNVGYVALGTFLSVGIHEFGHAIAAASEGVRVVYVAAFVVSLIPGAFVAFNNDALQLLSPIQALRIFCAGVWHNIVLCGTCVLGLVSLPALLSLAFEHAENPVVLNVPRTSPLVGYLSPGDIITGINGIPIHSPAQWEQELHSMHLQVLKEQQRVAKLHGINKDHSILNMNASHANRGFCVTNDGLVAMSNIEEGAFHSTCTADELTFTEIACSSQNNPDIVEMKKFIYGDQRSYCLRPKDVFHLSKCGRGWLESNRLKTCPCAKDEACMGPVLPFGSVLIEIMLYKMSELECILRRTHAHRRNISTQVLSLEEQNSCISSLLYEGNAAFLAHSLQLTSYGARKSAFFNRTPLWLPSIIEKFFIYTFYISAALSLINGAPIFYLDGELILETVISYSPVNSRKKRHVLQFLLVCCTALFLISIFSSLMHLLFVP